MSLSGKNILVTGADGFIGSHLVETLVSIGCNVRAFVYYNSFNNLGWLDSLPDEILSEVEIFSGDIRDSNGVRDAFNDIEICFHLAALIGIPYSYQSPESYVDTNVKGTLNILQAAKDFGCEKILTTSTSEIYGTALYVPIDEKHPLQAQSPYSATKIGADRLSESFHKSYELPVIIVRPFNTFGPRQSARAVIPAIIIQLLSGKREIELGDIHPTRDFVFIEDTVNGFIQIAISEKTLGEEINIASQTEISIAQVANKLISRINPEATIITDKIRIRPENSEVERLVGSNKKITELTNWKLKNSLDLGLDKTISWFKKPNNLKHYKPNFYNI